MHKHGGTPSRRDKHVTLAAISPPGVARGRFFGGQQSGLAGCKPPPLFTRGASSCSSRGATPGGTIGRLSTTECTYSPTYLVRWARWRRGSLASPLAAAFVVYFHKSIPFGACGGSLGRLSDPCVCRHTSCSSCALGFLVCVFCGGGALSGGVWFPPFGYVRVSLIPCFPCGRPRA